VSAAAKVMPPFSRQLVPFEGWVHIRCGQRGWKAAKWYRDRGERGDDSEIVYPGDKSPTVYQWPVKDCAVMVWGREHDLRQCSELVVVLIDAGALRVVLIHDDLPHGHCIYDTDRPRRVA